MRPGTGGCADTKDLALHGCDEEGARRVNACSPRSYVRLNDQEWGKEGRDPLLIFGGAAELHHESERLSRIDRKQSALSRLALMVRGL